MLPLSIPFSLFPAPRCLFPFPLRHLSISLPSLFLLSIIIVAYKVCLFPGVHCASYQFICVLKFCSSLYFNRPFVCLPVTRNFSIFTALLAHSLLYPLITLFHCLGAEWLYAPALHSMQRTTTAQSGVLFWLWE